MGKKAVRVSGELWQQICTVGWECGPYLRDGLECTEGLPEGATFHSAYYKPCYMTVGIEDFEVWMEKTKRPDLLFVFEHPDWPEIEPGKDVPILKVVHEKTREEPSYR